MFGIQNRLIHSFASTRTYDLRIWLIFYIIKLYYILFFEIINPKTSIFSKRMNTIQKKEVINFIKFTKFISLGYKSDYFDGIRRIMQILIRRQNLYLTLNVYKPKCSILGFLGNKIKNIISTFQRFLRGCKRLL